MNSDDSSITQASASTSSSKLLDTPCLLCDDHEVSNKKEMMKGTTFQLHKKVNDYAQLLNDKCLLSQFSAGDMIAILMCLSLHMPELAIQESRDVKCDMT